MGKDKNWASIHQHGRTGSSPKENVLRDTKRKFSDMLDEAKDSIVEGKTNSAQSIKVYITRSSVGCVCNGGLSYHCAGNIARPREKRHTARS